MICDDKDRSADVFEKGIVRRVEVSADIRSQLLKSLWSRDTAMPSPNFGNHFGATRIDLISNHSSSESGCTSRSISKQRQAAVFKTSITV